MIDLTEDYEDFLRANGRADQAAVMGAFGFCMAQARGKPFYIIVDNQIIVQESTTQIFNLDKAPPVFYTLLTNYILDFAGGPWTLKELADHNGLSIDELAAWVARLPDLYLAWRSGYCRVMVKPPPSRVRAANWETYKT